MISIDSGDYTRVAPVSFCVPEHCCNDFCAKPLSPLTSGDQQTQLNVLGFLRCHKPTMTDVRPGFPQRDGPSVARKSAIAAKTLKQSGGIPSPDCTPHMQPHKRIGIEFCKRFEISLCVCTQRKS